MIIQQGNFDRIQTMAIEKLSKLADRLRQVEISSTSSLEFNLADLSDPAVLNSICQRAKALCPNKSAAVYFYELNETEGYQALRQAFRGRSALVNDEGKELRYCRYLGTEDPYAIYVGSSRSFFSRTSQHLGRTGGPDTYSMRLGLWATHLSARVKLTVWSLSADVDQEALEFLEQMLWDEKRPLFGKRSGK